MTDGATGVKTGSCWDGDGLSLGGIVSDTGAGCGCCSLPGGAWVGGISVMLAGPAWF
jgi:hypothetical protein